MCHPSGILAFEPLGIKWITNPVFRVAGATTTLGSNIISSNKLLRFTEMIKD
jgi:hypothetical protein